MIVAIDGPAGSGKSTIAKEIARQLGFNKLDTGAMYRAVTLAAMRGGMFGENGSLDTERLKAAVNDIDISFRRDETTGKVETYLNGVNVEREIRTIDVSQHVSQVAALPFVRERLVAAQQAMGREKGVVMDGRDIGTVVFPDAELKIFVTATAEIRARRRFKELEAKGMPADYDTILENVQQRDYADSHREVSPLRKADDAILLDNSELTIDEQREWLLEKFKERTE